MNYQCTICGETMKYYDSVRRYVRKDYGFRTFIFVKRYTCAACHKYKRELPESLYRFKHYDAQIIREFIFGDLTSEDLRFEDYPSQQTIRRWKTTDFGLTNHL